MEAIIKVIAENPMMAILIGSPIGMILLFAAYKALLKILLSEKNIIKLADSIDLIVDKLQKKDKASGQETRALLIKLAERIIVDLKNPDGCN